MKSQFALPVYKTQVTFHLWKGLFSWGQGILQTGVKNQPSVHLMRSLQGSKQLSWTGFCLSPPKKGENQTGTLYVYRTWSRVVSFASKLALILMFTTIDIWTKSLTKFHYFCISNAPTFEVLKIRGMVLSSANWDFISDLFYPYIRYYLSCWPSLFVSIIFSRFYFTTLLCSSFYIRFLLFLFSRSAGLILGILCL